MEAPKRKRKITVLEKTEMLVVIEVWKDNVQALRSTSKNSHIYQKMCEELKDLGVILTAVELKNRIHNLTRKYRTERNAMGPSGGSPSSWEYFDTLHSFLHSYKQNNIRELMDEVIGSDGENCEVEYLDESMNPEDESVNQSESLLTAASTSSSTPRSTFSSSLRAISSAPKRKKQDIQERILELAEKENANTEAFFEHAKSTDLQIIELMRESNDLMSKMIDKM